MDKKYIFIDIDGTLYETKKKIVPPSAIEAIKKTAGCGHKVFICSGRPKTKVDQIFYDMPFAGYIYSCGSHIEVENKTIYKFTLPQENLNKIIDNMLKLKVGFVLDGLYKSFASKEAVLFYNHHYTRPNETIKEMLVRNGMYPFEEMDDADYKQICKITILSPKSDSSKILLKELPSGLFGYLNSEIHDGYDHGEIYPENIDKANAMIKVLEYYNAKLNQTIAIGDSANDIGMIKLANYGIAMGNGATELKNSADYITKDINEDGLALALKYVLNI